MQEVRTTCLDLAIRSGATAENAIRVARDFEAYVNESAKTPTGPSNEIDWSRRQLVKAIDPLRSVYGDNIIRTTGAHTDRHFIGRLVGAYMTAPFLKESFTYHGEIPKEEPKRKGLTFMEAVSSLSQLSMDSHAITSDGGIILKVSLDTRNLLAFNYRTLDDVNIPLRAALATDWKVVKVE